MGKRFIVFMFACLIPAVLAAQDKSRAESAPGKIVNINKPKPEKQIDSRTEEELLRALGVSESTVQTQPRAGLACTVTFEEPSGDQILSEGEKGTFIVVAANRTAGWLSPIIDISVKAEGYDSPLTDRKQMTAIGPNASGSTRLFLAWNSQLREGMMTFEVRASDETTGIVAEPARVSFRISGGMQTPPVPEFVDVDLGIPRILASNPDAIAVVIGNHDYAQTDVPDVKFAQNDARVMKNYLIQMLGIREGNILYFENATKTDFETLFGTKEIPQGKLYNYVKPGRSDVFVYFSGHGAPDVKNSRAYFMPVNADPNYVALTGYPLDVFYQNLGRVPSRSTTVILDACFSGVSDQGMLIRQASPMFIEVDQTTVGRANILTSATGTQISSWYPEGKHSLFTYYFLRGLRGEADSDNNRQVTVGEIRNYLHDQVPYMARRLFGREQTPVIKGDPNQVLCRY